MIKKVGFLLMLLNTYVYAQKHLTSNISNIEYQKGRGTTLTTSDSLFQMNIRFRMQSRFEYHKNSNQEQYRSGIRRFFIRTAGFIDNPMRWSYLVQFSLTENDIKNGKIISDAVIFYHLNKRWTFGVGKTRLPGNRQHLNSSGALQFIDRTINNSVFSLDKNFALHTHYTSYKGNWFYNFKQSLSFGGNNASQSKDNGWAYTSRIELFPLGRFAKSGAYFEGDLEREPTPKLYIGASYHYHYKARKTQGSRGKELYAPSNIQSYFIDAVFKYNGWAGMFSYMARTANDLHISEDSFVHIGYGIDTQWSYFFEKGWEIATKYSYNAPYKALKDRVVTRDEIAIGLTKYIWGHSFKVQSDVSYQRELAQMVKTYWQVRFQIEIGF